MRGVLEGATLQSRTLRIVIDALVLLEVWRTAGAELLLHPVWNKGLNPAALGRVSAHCLLQQGLWFQPQILLLHPRDLP